jgi:GT2 family glycosyltransferase
MAAPDVSIILPLSGGPLQALRCLEGIATQQRPTFEVIIVDDGSVGLDAVLACVAGDVQIVRSEQRLGLAGALTLGAGAATSSLLAIIRGAAVPGPDWLAPLVTAVLEPGTGLAASVTTEEPDGVLAGAWAAVLRRDDASLLEGGRMADPHVIPTLALELTTRGLAARRVTDSLISPPGARTGAARRAPGETAELTIVIPTLDATSDRVAGCLRAIAASTEVPHQIVLVDNGSPPQGFTAPVNAGIRAARTPYVVVMNDDVEPLSGWWEPLRAMLDAGAAVAFPHTIDGAMRTDFAAWCFAMTAETVGEFGYADGEFFDPSLVIWFQDTDLLLALQRAGRPPVHVPQARIRHGLSQTLATEDPQLSAWVREQIQADERCFRAKHAGLQLAPTTLTAAR